MKNELCYKGTWGLHLEVDLSSKAAVWKFWQKKGDETRESPLHQRPLRFWKQGLRDGGLPVLEHSPGGLAENAQVPIAQHTGDRQEHLPSWDG